MSLWDCAECGCRAIAHGLGFCPQCYTPKGEDMPKITSGGASNAWEPGDPEPEPEVAPETPEPETPEVPESAAPPAQTPPAAPKAAPASPKRSAPPSAPQEA